MIKRTPRKKLVSNQKKKKKQNIIQKKGQKCDFLYFFQVTSNDYNIKIQKMKEKDDHWRIIIA